MDLSNQMPLTSGATSSQTKGATLVPAPRWIVKRVPHRSAEPTPLALVWDEEGEQVSSPSAAQEPQELRVTVARWSEAALTSLRQLNTIFRTNQKRLPIVSLRSRIALADQNSLRLDQNLGIAAFGPSDILWSKTDGESCRTALLPAVLGWLVEDLASWANGGDAGVHGCIAQLKGLVRAGSAIETQTRKATPFAWAAGANQTTKSLSPTGYSDLADFVALQLENKTVLPDLSPLRRITGGELYTNRAELMTEPVQLGPKERFSIVIGIRILSYPGRSLPVVEVTFSRRVWTGALKSLPTVKSISGYALPPHSSRALRFALQRSKNADGVWGYQLDEGFAAIERRYFPGRSVTTDLILKEGHRLPECRLLVGLKHGAGERANAKMGVPDRDKMEAFQKIASLLRHIGLQPYRQLRKVPTSSSALKDANQHWSSRTSADVAKQKQYKAWRTETEESILACYSGRHRLIIAVQPGTEAIACEAETRLKEILPGSIDITRMPIAPSVHGPRKSLPGKDLSNAERAALRMAAWSEFIGTVKEHEKTTGVKAHGVLVIAHKWYSGKLLDDRVNQRAARVSLAKGLGISVQYLLPSDAPDLSPTDEGVGYPAKQARKWTPDQDIDKNFETRLMMSWLDLAFKSLGRLRSNKFIQTADKIFGKGMAPSRVLSLGVVRRNQTRTMRNDASILPFAIELDTKTGTCTARFAYTSASGGALLWTESLPLPQALQKIAGLGPLSLSKSPSGKERETEIQNRIQKFWRICIAEAYNKGEAPLILIDTDTSKAYWQWLTDTKIDGTNILIDSHYNAQEDWPDSVVVRVRTGNSPKVLWGNDYSGETEAPADLPVEAIRYEAPDWAKAELFKLNDIRYPDVYLSFGTDIRTDRVKGKSCYRDLPGMTKVIKKELLGTRPQTYAAATMGRHKNAWATPAGLEIVVIRSGKYEPEQIAQFVEILRQHHEHSGVWTTKPAPLYFEKVLKEYIADYEMDDDEESGESDSDEG